MKGIFGFGKKEDKKESSTPSSKVSKPRLEDRKSIKLTPLQKRVLLALRSEKDRLESTKEKVNFQRILLRFPKIHKVLQRIKDAHAKFDKDGGGKVEVDELHAALAQIEIGDEGGDEGKADEGKADEAKGQPMSKEDAEQLFALSDLSADGSEEGLDVKEFIVLCVISFILAKNEKDTEFVAGSNLLSQPYLDEAMTSIVSAYLAFDKDAKGYFKKDEMNAAVGEDGHAAALMTEERWKELDFDDSGETTFEEFVYAFSLWVAETEDDDVDEE